MCTAQLPQNKTSAMAGEGLWSPIYRGPHLGSDDQPSPPEETYLKACGLFLSTTLYCMYDQRPTARTYQTGWPNELSVRLPFWEIMGLEHTGSIPGRIKPMT